MDSILCEEKIGVALNGGSLEDAAHEYFKSSEQIPTRVRLAVGEEMSPGAGHRWRAGGILLQFLPKSQERARVADLPPGDAPEGTVTHTVEEDNAWTEGRSLSWRRRLVRATGRSNAFSPPKHGCLSADGACGIG